MIGLTETIRGLNVAIGSDTTGLSKALSDVNKKSRDIQSELKQVEKLLKLDPSNTELVAQKQKLLSDAIANASEKLDRLRSVQEQVNEQFRRGEISEGQYRAFQREVVASEQALQRLGQRLEDTQEKTVSLSERMQEVGKKVSKAFQDMGEKIKGIGEKMSIGLTAPIVAAGAVLAKGAMDTQAAVGQIQADLGVTAQEAEKLGAAAQEVWKSGFVDSIDEATNAITSVRQNMAGIADNELAAVAQGAAVVAQRMGEDVSAVTAAAGVAMKNFGISGQDALDLITVGMQKGGNYSGELLDTIREYSPQFASMGLSAEQAMGMLIAGAEAGAFNLDKVGDAVKEFNIRAQDGSKTTTEGFAAIGLDAQKMGADIAAGGDQAQQAFMATVAAIASMKDPMEQNQAGVALFGTQWEDVRSQVIVAMADGANSLGDFKGAMDAAKQALAENNPGLALTQAMRGLSVAITPALTPIVSIIVNNVVPALKSMAEWFTNLSPAGQKTVLIIAGIAAVIGPLLVVVGTIISAITTLTPLFAALTGPIGIAVAAIAALIAIGVAVYKNWDAIKAKAKELLDNIKQTFENIKTSVVEKFNSIIDAGKNFILKLWQGIKNVASSFLHGGIIGVVNDYILKPFFNIDLFEIGGNIIKGLWNGIKSLSVWLYQKVSTFVKENIIDTVKKFLGIASPSKVMAEFGQYVAQGLAEGINGGSNKVREQSEKMAQAITAAVQVMTGNLANALDVTRAKFDLEKESLADNATETQKLAIKLKSLSAEKESLAAKVDILSTAYETARKRLGENNETTKQYAHELRMAQIELQKTEIAARKTETAISVESQKAVEATRAQAQELRNLADEITVVETKYRDDLAAALTEYQQKVVDTNEKLAADEQRLTQEYENQVEQRAKSLRDFVGLFDAVTSEEVSGDQLLENLRGQVTAFENWQENIAELSARGVDEGLIAELQQMGPKAGPQIAALNNLTDSQLSEYVSLWQQKSAGAREEAISQLESQRIETLDKIAELRVQAAEQLEAYKVEWEKKNEAIRKNVTDELAKIETKYKEITDNSTGYGVKLMDNFIGGIESRFDALRSTLESMAEMVDSYMPHSPAKVGPLKRLNEWGPALVKGLADGILSSLPDLASVSSKMAALSPAVVSPSVSSNYNSNTVNSGGNNFYITVQDGEDLMRALRRSGVRV